MPWVLLIVGALLALFTIHSHRPLRRPGSIVFAAWFATYVLIELPLHSLVVQVAAVLALAGAGGVDDWPGFVGLGLCGISWLGLFRHYSLARRTAVHVDRALVTALGADYDNTAREHLGNPVPPRWWRLLRVLPIRHRHVERHRNITYHTIGKRRLKLDVYRRRSRPTNCPVLLYIHGGGWVIGNKGEQGLVTVNHLASLGWVCVSINYRLSPRATFPDHILDVKRAIKWVREHVSEYGGDPSFVILAGGSAGAHLGALAALTPNALEYQREFPDVDTAVQGCVAYYGVYDFTDRHAHWPHRTLRLLLERVIMKRRFDHAREEFEKASPLYQVGPHAPPFFLLHGDRDNLAPVDEARRFAEELRRSAIAPVAYAELPGAQHAFELLPSIRSLHAIEGVGRFCEHVYDSYLSAAADTHNADPRCGE